MNRRIVSVLLLLAGLCAVASAQSDKAQGYAFFSPGWARAEGDSEFLIGVGGGGVVRLGDKGAAVNFELAGVGERRNFKDSAVGLASFNVGYYAKGDAKAQPFATGGYSLAFRNDTAHGANFGAGVNYWFAPRAGLLLEARPHPALRAHHGERPVVPRRYLIQVGKVDSAGETAHFALAHLQSRAENSS